jgi:hypothetical protein
MEMRIKAKEEGETTLGLESWVAQLGARAFLCPVSRRGHDNKLASHTSLTWEAMNF